MIDIDEEIEKVILVGVALGKNETTNESLDELEELVKTANAITVGRVVQGLETINNATYIGKGKTLELKDLIIETGATGIVCDDELSPMQIRNLEDELDTKVMDRTMVILDIFASRASTKEGKIQVELAQLRYRSTRLTGKGISMSRLGGGIGTRGPGEKKLETDRRIIKDRISNLSSELNDVIRHRTENRKRRTENNVPVVCIVGYTNAGKSTLLNTLTDANVLEEDKLFATLDPTTRELVLPSGQKVLLTDTVGFISKLPHHLVNAFRSTLEEAKYADIIIHVVDSSNPRMDGQMHTVYETLDKLEVKEKIIITAFNKTDKEECDCEVKDLRADETVYISALKGKGLDTLLEVIEKVILESKVYIEKVFPYSKTSVIQLIRNNGQLLLEEYQGDGILVKAYVSKQDAGKIERLLQ